MTQDELWYQYQMAEKRLSRCRDASVQDPTGTRLAEQDVQRTLAAWINATNADLLSDQVSATATTARPRS